jgi:hypothetical protein
MGKNSLLLRRGIATEAPTLFHVYKFATDFVRSQP